MIGPRHVLTASHCFPRTVDTWQGTTPLAQISYPDPAGTGAQVFVGNVVGAISHLSSDAEVLLLDRDTGIEPVRVLDEPIDSWVGRRVFASGYGNVPSGSNGAWLTITGFLTDGRRYNYGSATEAGLCAGDSGGPDFAFLSGRWYVVGIHKSAGCAPSSSSSTRLDRGVAMWIRSLVPVRDSIQWDARRPYFAPVTTTNGTTLLGQTPYGLTTGVMSPAALQLSLGRTETAYADFDGDGVGDLLTLGPRRMTIYKSGNFAATPWYDWNGDVTGVGRSTQWSEQLGLGNMAVADFNGDGRADILRTDVNGTRLILSNGTTLNDAPVPVDVANSRVYENTVTVADFSGDGIADAMFQDASGARFYFGQAGTAGLSVLKSTNSTLVRGSAHVTPGRFVTKTGLARDLIVASSSSGTQLWVSNGSASGVSFTIPWTRTDLRPNENAYHVGDTNGDGLDDLLISNPSGSYLYQATGTTTSPWIPNTWSNTGVKIENSDFHFANFDGPTSLGGAGDGKADLWIIRPEGSYGYKGTTSGLIPNAWFYPEYSYQHFRIH
ncbi:MAG: trypsin-like serine protease [Polyangiaceae bacterium]|nr:trypsin-like serine protease [Polyangiaceae bacterium]